jgi:RNA polymerase sigma factor (sigma-70 family)
MRRMVWPKNPNERSRDEAALEFHRLIREHVPAFYRSAYRWTGAVDRAEDLVQELLTRLYPMLGQLRTIDKLRPWAMRVMYRIFIDQLRRERNSPVQFGLATAGEESAEDEDADYIDPSAEPPELVEQQLTQDRILAAWALMAEEHRVVLSMHDIEGYSLIDLSSILDVPLGTLKSRLHRARAKLRELLAAERF